MQSSPRKSTTRKSAPRTQPAKPVAGDENVTQLRSLAHDLSNALEGILQACYLLSHAKLEGDSRRWVELIDKSSQDAARINREIRKILRSLSSE